MTATESKKACQGCFIGDIMVTHDGRVGMVQREIHTDDPTHFQVVLRFIGGSKEGEVFNYSKLREASLTEMYDFRHQAPEIEKEIAP